MGELKTHSGVHRFKDRASQSLLYQTVRNDRPRDSLPPTIGRSGRFRAWSRHLAYLRHAGVVAARREGKWVHYKIVLPRIPGRPKSFAKRWRSSEKTKRGMTDLTRLNKLCCVPQKVSALNRTPRPILIEALAGR